MAPNDARPHQQLSKDKEKRRRQLERLRHERQLQRRAEAVARARKRAAIIGGAVAAVLVIGGVVWAVSPSDSKKASADAAPSASASTAASATPSASPTYKQWKTEPAMTIDKSATYTAKIKLDQGTVTLKLDASKAPHTVNSFVFLAKQGFFDNVKCHRLTTAGIYVLQCGDPSATGSGGPGYNFTDENLKAFGSGTQVTYPAGTVAMANSGANTNGSQFFLVYKDSPLAPSYTPFGTITGGLDTLKAIAAKGVSGGGTDGAPAQPVVMKSVTATKS